MTEAMQPKPAGTANVPFDIVGNQRWFAVHSQPHREAQAQAQLAQQRFTAFLPRQIRTVRHARKLRTVSAPIFPRYLFVAFDLERDRWRAINSTAGVNRIVMAEDRPVPLPKGIVETLIRSSDEKGLVHFEDELVPGQTVRLIAGPFAQSLGVLARLDGGARVEVLMKILNGELRLSLSRDWVQPADG